MSTGQLSYSKARALTRVATPATEDVLLNVALNGTTHHVETLVRQFRRVQEVEELSREARQYSQRRLTYFHDSDGSLVVKLQLTAESGALFLKAIEAALPEIALPDDCKDSLHVSAETSSTPAMRRADAIVVMAESLLQHGAAAMKGGDRHQVVVHIDDATLRKGESGRCEIDDGPAIPVETARRLSCDCSKVEITEDGQGEPLDVGRKTRSIPPAMRRALAARDKGCVFPGCNHKRYVDGHHVQHWADGGETKLSNLATLCRFHHRTVHEGGLRMERCDDGAWRFYDARGQLRYGLAPGHTQPLGDWRQLPAEHAGRGIHIDASTATTGWRGERMDYGVAIDSLLFRSARQSRGAVPRCAVQVLFLTPAGLPPRHCPTVITAEQFDTVAGQFDFLRRIDAAAIKEFQQAVTYSRLPAGKRLFSEGDGAQALALVVAGTVRVFKTGRNGREITLYRIGEGETCILSVNAILTQQPLPAAATVEEPVEAVTIAAGVLRDWVHRHPLWRQFVFELISQRLLKVLNLVDDVVFSRMDARIASLLLDRSRMQNPLHITHQEIAAELGTSREVISRILEGLAGAGVVRATRGRIEVLDAGSLETLASP